MNIFKVSSASSLLRFLNPKIGPVVSLVSAPYPNFLRRTLWHSTAMLHPEISLAGCSKILDSCGSGWSVDKEESQCKAITEAIERWALFHHLKSLPESAGLDIDGSSTGFAAMPQTFGEEPLIINAYCEALERWVLSRMWDYRDIAFQYTKLQDGMLIQLFSRFHGALHCFKTHFTAHPFESGDTREIVFYLCVFETEEGGAIPGSACGLDDETTRQRAILETFVHARALMKMRKQKISSFQDIIEQRLHFFANNINGYRLVNAHIVLSGESRNKMPEIIFSKNIAGPWNPEIRVHRVIMRDSLPFAEGGSERFLI